MLRPDDKDVHRLIVIGQQQLPDTRAPQGRARRSWAFVDKVTAQPEDFEEALARRHGGGSGRGDLAIARSALPRAPAELGATRPTPAR
ncbi:hypothetical protein [Sorangium sp. So ce542]|uniref:hypothetical protein n=1 Tax=Sorangium sp. So ce542 TaxID=3133316 RepID=UPI003F5ED7DE